MRGAGENAKRLRERRGMSQAQVAAALNRRRPALKVKQQSIDQFEKGKSTTPRFLPDLAELFGVDLDDLRAGTAVAPDGDAAPTVDEPPLGTATSIDEVDVRAGAGLVPDIDHITTGDMPRERVVNRWQLPEAMLRGQTTADLAALRILTIVGNSMEPILPSGAKVLVDTSDTLPQPSGFFVVWEGLGVAAKAVEMIPHSDPPTVRIKSLNPIYSDYERVLGEAHIQGRIIGHWKWT